MNSIEPHTKLLSIHKSVEKQIITDPFFTVKDTIELMKRYSHLTYIAVQASRGADRCDREGKNKGIVKYVALMQKAHMQKLELESKMHEWSKL